MTTPANIIIQRTASDVVLVAWHEGKTHYGVEEAGVGPTEADFARAVTLLLEIMLKGLVSRIEN